MKHISFELTMPNVGSWNGKWTGADKKYYIVKKFSDKFFKSEIKKLFYKSEGIDCIEGDRKGFYYNFGDGWGANVTIEIIDSKEASKRRKLSKGFAGYDWMVNSIIQHGTIQSTKLQS
jgi:hypothetical protein